MDPASLRPMKATSSAALPLGEAWAYEVKWDGMRVLAAVAADGVVRLWSSTGADTTAAYPELHALGAAAPGHALVLDGEVVAFDDEGRPSFGRLQQRMHVGSPADAARRAALVPVTYVVFDLLGLDGVDATSLPYDDRRRLLTDLLVADSEGRWLVPPHHTDGEALLEVARQRGLEGVMAKRRASPYVPGKRSADWRKVKVRLGQEVVIGGWQPGGGGRDGRLGSLLVGVYEGGRLRFAGKVGTGFTDAELDRLGGLLAGLATDDVPFDPPPPRAVARLARWVRPELVAQVQLAEWTGDGVMRHPSYLGLRDDKAPTDVVREG